MATPHGLPPLTVGWQHWVILFIVITLVLIAMLFVPG
jgi:hypothetical protein